MGTPPSKFFNRYEFDEDVRDERDRLRAVNGQLLLALRLWLTVDWSKPQDATAFLQGLAEQARVAIAEAQKATGGQ